MDTSDLPNKNGNGHGPDQVSLPSAAAPPAGGPVSVPADASAAAAATPTGPPVKRDPKGRFPKGTSGNEATKVKKGEVLNPHGIQSYNRQLWAAIRKMSVVSADGTTTKGLEILLKQALTNPEALKKLLDKLFADATPPAAGTKVEVNNNNALQNSETHVAIGKLLSDPEGRAALADLAERCEARRVFSGDDGVGH